MNLGTILIILLVIFLVGGFSGNFYQGSPIPYGYGYGGGGIGILGIVLLIVIVLVVLGRL